MKKTKKICFVTTVKSMVEAFLLEHLRKLNEEYDITIILNEKDETFLEKKMIKGVKIIPLNIEREISLIDDLKVLKKMIKIFKIEKYDLVHSLSPKAGLLTAIAAKIAKIEKRLHIFTGQVWFNYKGIKKSIFKFLDKIIVFCNTAVMCDSPSQRGYLEEENVIKKGEMIVFGKGSINGVDTEKFIFKEKLRKKIRKELKIQENEIVIGFVGRLKKDKGIIDLIEAVKDQETEKIKLLIIGPDEEDIEKKYIKNKKNIIYLGFQEKIEVYMNVMDIFCMPSYREGFGNVFIEAASMGIPSIGTNIYGVKDAIEDGVTGFLCSVGDIGDINKKIKLLLNNQELRKKMGEQARKRVKKNFYYENITEEWLKYYKKILK